uniref:Uncharacterized protein MANES_02G174200 n=1 Tax=Rhizophora mucronata TaxID=61149 RepID=A0A2P2L1E7_RHIMU
MVMVSEIRQEYKDNPLQETQNNGYQIQQSLESRNQLGKLVIKHISQDSPREALMLYQQIRRKGPYFLGIVPLILKACASMSLPTYGKSLHGEAIKNGGDSDVLVGTSLIDMYGKCGDVKDSRKMFDCMPERTVVTWNAMIGGYIRNGDMESASRIFGEMPTRSPVTWNEMIGGFAKSGDLVKARCMFDQMPSELRNVVTWTVMVDGYASKGEMAAARPLFENMPERNFFVWSSMISGYCKIGDVKEARDIFDQIPARNLVNWNALISGYTQNGFAEEALEAFRKMQDEGFEPNEVTVVSILSACSQLGLLDVGKDIHLMINNTGIKLNQFVENALIDMYAKCGDLANARLIFETMECRNVACWNSIISGLATHGQSEEAVEFFRKMEELNEKPDEITFLSLLSACAHGGLADEGLEIFSKMEKYGLVASIKHCGCVVDLLGRVGRLQDAHDFIKKMPMKPNDAVWGAFLGACHIYSDKNMAEKVLEEVGTPDFTLDSSNDSHYVLMSNIFAASDSWEKAERVRMEMVNKGLEKTLGHSSLVLVKTEM